MAQGSIKYAFCTSLAFTCRFFCAASVNAICTFPLFWLEFLFTACHQPRLMTNIKLFIKYHVACAPLESMSMFLPNFKNLEGHDNRIHLFGDNILQYVVYFLGIYLKASFHCLRYFQSKTASYLDLMTIYCCYYLLPFSQHIWHPPY